MRYIIMAFSAGMSLAVWVLAGEEDLRTGGPWILSLIVFPACALLCLAFTLRDYKRRESAEGGRADAAVKERSDAPDHATEGDVHSSSLS
ncbi:hypothetical protein [Brevibacterium epidermidis]|uniref:hypothetical protein n=1 Tax=Brevibacterium epidermidis TaxID=1698 RepID=UPI0012ED38AF|nr:hypothetical protein [Brevibacterium epidermidis]